MSKKYVNIQVSLIDLSSDSESDGPVHPPLPQPTPSPAGSRTRSIARSPIRYPTVSDDEDSDVPPGFQPIRRRTTHSPARRTVTPPPRVPAPAPLVAPVPVSHSPLPAPRVHYQARMSAGIRPTHQLAPRDPPATLYPYSTYERGESSRQPDFTRHMDALSAQVRDTRCAYFEMQGAQGRVLGRLGDLERDVDGWREIVNARVHLVTDSVRRGVVDVRQRMSLLERWAMGAMMLAVAALLVAVIPLFYPRS